MSVPYPLPSKVQVWPEFGGWIDSTADIGWCLKYKDIYASMIQFWSSCKTRQAGANNNHLRTIISSHNTKGMSCLKTALDNSGEKKKIGEKWGGRTNYLSHGGPQRFYRVQRWSYKEWPWVKLEILGPWPQWLPPPFIFEPFCLRYHCDSSRGRMSRN